MSRFSLSTTRSRSSDAAYLPTVSSETVDLRAVLSEVEAGLPNERDRVGCAQLNLDYYHGDNERHLDFREAENAYDYQRRPKRCTMLTRRVVEVLTSHLYNPG